MRFTESTFRRSLWNGFTKRQQSDSGEGGNPMRSLRHAVRKALEWIGIAVLAVILLLFMATTQGGALPWNF